MMPTGGLMLQLTAPVAFVTVNVWDPESFTLAELGLTTSTGGGGGGALLPPQAAIASKSPHAAKKDIVLLIFMPSL